MVTAALAVMLTERVGIAFSLIAGMLIGRQSAGSGSKISSAVIFTVLTLIIEVILWLSVLFFIVRRICIF